MINLTVLYPYDANKKFDKDYYTNSHVPLVKSALGTTLKSLSYELGVSGMDPTSPPAFFCIFHLTFDSINDLAAAAPKMGAFIADMPNYTDTQAIIQVSEVKA